MNTPWTGSTIYIRADRSVEPGGAPLSTSDKKYFITGDVINTGGDGIVVERGNVIIEGSNQALTGRGEEKGIRLEGRRNVTVRNIRIENFGDGIYLDDSSGNTIANNTVSNNNYGIYLWESSNNDIYRNNFIANSQQVYSYNSVNVRDDGYPSGGNYWSEHSNPS
ncbi:MAG: right-handed parallel beta-helix repeat-containing protein [Candidatus Brockarchaeota archaeon]|nr:right-handed parallel beta-helix repeat-containing protein [Candidatus Brockarchaeota archaeon]